ncbi:MAG: hypothetical protein CMG61_01270 [Candidatus Marinimicrobia bacterium]|nr:hypothetical protein [Candidatus Neomarinimicrobiota bacterium]
MIDCDGTYIGGCTNPDGCNYNENILIDDGSCIFPDNYPDNLFNCEQECIYNIDCCNNCDANDSNNCTLDANQNCIYDLEVFLCGVSYPSSQQVIFTVCSNSNTSISAYQFSLNALNFDIIEVMPGNDAIQAGMQNYDNSNQSAIIFSYSGNFIPSSPNIKLATFRGNYTNANGLIEIIPSYGQNGSISFANSNAEELSFLITNTEWSQIPND